MAGRIDLLLGSIDLGTSKGLELGPLAKPVVTRGMGDVRYLDHIGTEALRARYSTHAGFDVDSIVPIDYASGAGSICEAVGTDAPFDYVIASHVIEHVPDLIRWLLDIRSVLGDGGVLALAIPDHRRCFDALRAPTTAAEVIHANLTAATTPSPRQVFDHMASAVSWHGLISWEEEPPFAELVSVHSERAAIDRASEISGSDEYQDVHCWVFTPASFVRLFASLLRLELVPFSLDSCSDPVGGEFFVRLRAADVSTATMVAAEPPADVDRMPSTASEHAALRAELAATRADRDDARDELDRTVGSRSWKLTRPLRAFNRALARIR